MKPASLSARIVVVMVLALAPAFLATAYSLFTLFNAQRHNLHVEASRIAELVSLELDQTVEGAEAILHTVAAARALGQGHGGECPMLLANVIRDVDYLAAVQILEADGSVSCAAGAPLPLAGLDGQGLIESATDEAIVGRAVRHEQTGELVLPIALRLEATEGRDRRAAVAFLDMDWLEARLENRTISNGGALTIADSGGTILARVPEPERFVGTQIPAPFMEFVRAEEPGSAEVVSQDGTERVIGYQPPAANDAGLYISAGLSESEGYAVIRSVAYRAVLMSAAGILLTGAVALYTARVFVARPVQRLIDTVAAWRKGDVTARTGLAAKDGEICLAGHSVDAFMDELLATREARRRADTARDLMRDELEHREKNLMATVQAVARQTFSGSDNMEANRIFAERLNVISKANSLLKRTNWQSTPLRDLLAETVATFVGKDQERVSMAGPDIVIKASVVTILAMAVHELCTNAVKYGALSNASGTIQINWRLTGLGVEDAFAISWTERGGPSVGRPRRTGFGTRLIRDALASQTSGKVEIDYDPQGLTFRLTAPASGILAAPEIIVLPTPHPTFPGDGAHTARA
jgi:two-component sensor histidine kinase